MLYKEEKSESEDFDRVPIDNLKLCKSDKFPYVIPKQEPTWLNFTNLNSKIEKTDYNFGEQLDFDNGNKQAFE